MSAWRRALRLALAQVVPDSLRFEPVRDGVAA